MSNRHILIVTQYFHPEPFRISDIAAQWARRGYRVTVVTGIPNYPSGRFFDGFGLFRRRRERREGVDILRLPQFPRGRGKLMLALNYASFALSGFFWAHLTRLRPDVVFIFGLSPITLALPGVWFARRRRVPCLFYVQDLWPDSLMHAAGIQNARVLGAAGRIVDYVYARCDKVLVTSRGFIKEIGGRGVPPEKIEYWPQYAEPFYKPLPREAVPEIPEDGALNLTFTGNVGVAQGIDVLCDAARLLAEQRPQLRVRFNIVGDGRHKADFCARVERCGLSHCFNLIGQQPAERIPALLAASDGALLCLGGGALFAMTVPAKLQSYLACGIPVLTCADGEVSALVEQAGAGLCARAGDARALADNIAAFAAMDAEQRAAMGRQGRAYFEAHFECERLLAQMDTWLAE